MGLPKSSVEKSVGVTKVEKGCEVGCGMDDVNGGAIEVEGIGGKGGGYALEKSVGVTKAEKGCEDRCGMDDVDGGAIEVEGIGGKGGGYARVLGDARA